MNTPVADTNEQVPEAPSRRCWRCLQDFECDTSDLHKGPAQWWLCEPCHKSLIGPARSR